MRFDLLIGAARRALAIAAMLLVCAPGRAAAELIDRVLAIIEGQVITLSEVQAAIDLGLVSAAGAPDPITASLERLLERELILTEVERYAPPEPSRPAIEGRLALVRQRFPTAEAFQAALAKWGYTEVRLRDIIRDDLRIQTYLEQRFASAGQPTDAEVARYYGEHEAEFAVNGEVPPLATIQELVREKLGADRRRQLIADWIGGLRRRSDVIVLQLPS